jgi:hypothetical protein
MMRPRNRLCLGLLATLIVCLAPAFAAADSVVFTNECRFSVVVHTSAVVKGRLVRNRPYLLRPRESSPAIPRRSDVLIKISHAQSVNRVLYQGALRAGTSKLHRRVVPGKSAKKVHLRSS